MAQGYVRAARVDEADEIARIQIDTWRVAYRRLLPARQLDQLDHAWMAQRWREAIQDPPDHRHRVLVAIEQAAATHLVGFCGFGPADNHALMIDEAPLPDTTAAITELLVEPRWGRRGHGSRLLAASVAAWQQEGFTTAVAWTFEADVATRTFLTSAGWEPDGARRALDVDDLLVHQIRMHTALPEPTPEQ